MRRLTNETRLKLCYVLCLIGIYTTWMLTFSHVMHIHLPCGGSNDCATVAMSRASSIGGVPVALWGLALYALLASLTMGRMIRPQSRSESLLYPLSALGALVSTGFSVYAATVLHAGCIWCLTSNVTMCALALLAGFDRDPVSQTQPPKPDRWFLSGSTGILVLGMVVGSMSVRASSQRFHWDPEALASASVADMIPPDALELNATSSGLNVVMFIDMNCEACHDAFQLLYPRAVRNHINLVIRHLPLKAHKDSVALATFVEEASKVGRGFEYLDRAFQQKIGLKRQGQSILDQFKIRPSRADMIEAAKRVRRDRMFAKQLGLIQTPSMFIVKPNHTNEAVSLDALLDRMPS